VTNVQTPAMSASRNGWILRRFLAVSDIGGFSGWNPEMSVRNVAGARIPSNRR
jgi:hypothetical protein